MHLLSLGAPLLVTEAGEQIKFRTRKHFALLIRLAVEAGKKLTREYLIDLLWADAPAHLARHSLAQALTVLKAKVGPEHVLIQRATVALAEGAVDADVRHLDGCDVQIRGPFLEGFDVPNAASFEQWKDEWRAKLMPRIRDCLVTQMDAGRRIGDFATVERHAQVLYEFDSLSEDAVRGVMEARAWVGDRTNALKAYSRFEAHLAEELGAKPSADLARIAGLLREGRRATPRLQAADAPEQREQRFEKRFEAETLIGREKEFAVLYDAWLEIRRRTPRIVVVTGDPGIGKTTLANAFVSTCQMEGAVIARAQAYDAERELPFAVLAELVKQMTTQRAIGGADPEALSELSRVSPEIFNAFPGVPKPIEWSAEVIPLRLADAFLKAVEAAADESPLVLVVDDIHAADNASAAILHVVARKLPCARLLVILTGRSNELRTAAAPSALVSDATIQALGTLELEPLSPESAERLVAKIAAAGGTQLGELPTARIVQAGNGNPLAIELLTREWLAHGASSLLGDLEALNTQPVANLGIPRAIGTVFERQVRRLDAAAHAALDLGAVLGRRLAHLPLYQIVNLPPAAAGEALSRLREEGLLREVHESLEFRNELIRAQAYYAVTGPVRQHLHRQVGEMLAAHRWEEGQAPRLEIAWHFLRGGDPALAVPHALEGAEVAIGVGAPYEAEQILLALLREPAARNSTQRIRLLLAKALLDQSKAEAAIPVLDELLSEPTLPVRDFAHASRMRAAAEYLMNREPGLGYCESADRALAAARQTDDPDLIGRALFEYARSGVNSGDERRVMAVREETGAMIEQPTAQKLPVLYYTRAYCDYFFFDLRSSARDLETAIGLLSQSTNPAELSLAYTGYGSCKQGLCEFEAAYQILIKALELARKIGDDSRASIIASNLCGVRTQQGHYKSATEFGELGVKLGSRALNQPLLAISFLNLATTYLLDGQRSRAVECIDCGHISNRGERSWGATVEFLLLSASVALTMGNLPSALELAVSAQKAAWSKERAVPNAGLFDKLKILSTAHLCSPDAALILAQRARDKYRDHHTLYYFDALACNAWLEKRILGGYTTETERELEDFTKLGAAGKRAILVAQGFLP